jgi:hypothetical protein
MSWRTITEADLPSCLEVRPANLGDELVGREAAVAAWRILVADPFFITAAFEADPSIQGRRIIAFGASAFVSAAFMDAEIAHPQPCINSRIIASVHAGQSVVLTPDQIANANAGAGLDTVILSGSWCHTILSPSESTEVQTLIPMAYIALNAGYRLRRILWETSSETEERFARLSGVYTAIGAFPQAGRVLNLMTQSSVVGVPGSLGNVLFRYADPLLRLREPDRQLLIAAERGVTDTELATALGLSLSAVKARWRSIFSRIVEVKPDLVDGGNNGAGRGLQKRHRVLAYVREHPENLRPYAWKETAAEN